MPNLGPSEIIVIVLLLFVLFGFKRLPDAARSIGKSARVFKAEVNELKVEDEARKQASAAQGATQAQQTVPAQTVPTAGAEQGFPAQAGNAVQESAQVVDGVIQNPPTNSAS